MRARLFRVGVDDHVLVGVVHHRRGRGFDYSVGADLGAAYAARSQGTAPGWSPLAVTSTSITRCGSARRVRDLDDPDSAIGAQLAYWEQALAGMPDRVGVAHRSALSGGG